jgi:hypothetical protein
LRAKQKNLREFHHILTQFLIFGQFFSPFFYSVDSFLQTRLPINVKAFLGRIACDVTSEDWKTNLKLAFRQY